MKPSRLFILILLLFGCLSAAELPFHKGVNLSNWLWSKTGAEDIVFSRYGKEDMENIKSLGCDVIRLPLSLLFFSDGEPDYTLDPLFFDFLDRIVTWAEELQIYLILDNHTQKSGSSYVPLGSEMLPMWVQIAGRYSDRSEYILYEIMNEPHNLSSSKWYEGQDSTIAAIREVDSSHYIIAAPIWNSISSLNSFIPYAHDKLIYAFHFYDPFLFTHQGASWADPQLINLANVPFPGRTGDIPDCPEDLLGTYVENSLLEYPDYANVDELYNKIDVAVNFSEKYDLPVICDEFGVYAVNAPQADRVYWHRMITDYLSRKNIPWTIWGYKGSFGIMKSGTSKIFHSDLDPDMIDALAMEMPFQDTILVYPDTCGFVLYDESLSRHITPKIHTDKNNYNFYSSTRPGRGKYCLNFQNPQQYDYIGFNFDLYRDVENLADKGACISFMIRSDAPAYATLRFRFRDEAAPGDPRVHWTAVKTLDNNNTGWSDSWHRVEIPLSAFHESPLVPTDDPDAAFDWSRLNSLEIVSNDYKLVGSHFYFDDIKIILPGEEVGVSVMSAAEKSAFIGTWPNPFNHQLQISYNLAEEQTISLSLLNIRGQKIQTLERGYRHAGDHSVVFSAQDLPGGIYLLQLAGSDFKATRKILYLK